MKVSDIKVGEYYRIKGNKTAWAQVLEILPPKTGENNSRTYVAKCKWVINKDANFGMIRYFRVSELIKEER